MPVLDKDEIGLYEQRLLVFLETEPQSNEYNQVYLTKEQFKKVSDSICVPAPQEIVRKGIEIVKVEASEEIYFLPDLQSINEVR